MPLTQARTNRVRTLRHNLRLQEPNRARSCSTARFIGDTADYILNQLIETTLGRIPASSWRAEQPEDVAGAAGLSLPVDKVILC